MPIRQRLKTPWATNQSIGKARNSENLVKSFPNDIARKGGEGSTTLSRLDYVTYFYRWMTLLIVFSAYFICVYSFRPIFRPKQYCYSCFVLISSKLVASNGKTKLRDSGCCIDLYPSSPSLMLIIFHVAV